MAQQLTDQDLELIRGRNFVHITTLSADGSPSSSVVWADEENGEIVIGTAADRAKVANIRRDPRVSLSLHDEANPYRSLNVAGTARLDSDGAEELIDSLTKKFIDQDRYPAEWRSPDEIRLTIRVKPEKIHRYGY